MSDADTEAVLYDLLLELRVEGVTLWQIRCFASVLHNKKNWDGRGLHPNNWLASDLRGEDAVLAEAYGMHHQHVYGYARTSCA